MFNRNGGGSRGGFGDKRGGSGGGGFGRREGGDRGGFGRRDGGDRARPEMHKAVCAECGSSCEVPFKPSGERPVLCSACFGNKDAGAPRQSFSRDRDSSRDFPKPNFNNDRNSEPRAERPSDHSKEQFEALNAKLDKVIRALEQLSAPTSAPKSAPVKEVIKETIKFEAPVKEVKKAEVKKIAVKEVKKIVVAKKKTTKK